MLDGSQLLIGSWNVDIADTNGANRNPDAFQTVFAAMGQEDLYATPQPPDILTVTEVRSNSNTGSNNDTQWLTDQMNAVYGDEYSHGALNAFSSGGGTEGVIYNSQTVSLLEEIAIGRVSSTGPARQEYRYLFRPVGYDDGSADFYVYVGHYKAGLTSTDINRRNVEAQQVRADANGLGPGVPILYTGDFNTDGSDEPAELSLLSPGDGQAFDPVGRLGHWYNSATFLDLDSIGSTNLDSRFDLLWETAPVVSGTGGYGLQDMPWTYHTFGDDGSVPLHQAIDYAGNTALPDLDNRLDVLHDLARACSDHLPVLQDYQIVPPFALSSRGHGRPSSRLLPALASLPSALPKLAEFEAFKDPNLANQSPAPPQRITWRADERWAAAEIVVFQQADQHRTMPSSIAGKIRQANTDSGDVFQPVGGQNIVDRGCSVL